MHSLIRQKFSDAEPIIADGHYGVLKVQWTPLINGDSVQLDPCFYELTQGKKEWSDILTILDDMETSYEILKTVPLGCKKRNFKADLAQHYFALDINYPVDNMDPCNP